jgi:hypothetical protein
MGVLDDSKVVQIASAVGANGHLDGAQDVADGLGAVRRQTPPAGGGHVVQVVVVGVGARRQRNSLDVFCKLRNQYKLYRSPEVPPLSSTAGEILRMARSFWRVSLSQSGWTTTWLLFTLTWVSSLSRILCAPSTISMLVDLHREGESVVRRALGETYSSPQWAAVRTVVGDRREAPQKAVPSSVGIKRPTW